MSISLFPKPISLYLLSINGLGSSGNDVVNEQVDPNWIHCTNSRGACTADFVVDDDLFILPFKRNLKHA